MTNPLFYKELIVAARKNRVIYIIFALALVFTVGKCLFFAFAPNLFDLEASDRSGYLSLYLFEVGLIGVVGLFVFSTIAATAISGERHNRTFALLETALLSEREIVYGKFGALMLVFAVYLCAFLPALSLTGAFFGVGWWATVIMLLALLGSGAVLVSAALLASTHRETSIIPIITAVVLGGIYVVYVLATAGVAEELSGGRGDAHNGVITALIGWNFYFAVKEILMGSFPVFFLGITLPFTAVFILFSGLLTVACLESAVFMITPGPLRRTRSARLAISAVLILVIANLFCVADRNAPESFLVAALIVAAIITADAIIRETMRRPDRPMLLSFPLHVIFLVATALIPCLLSFSFPDQEFAFSTRVIWLLGGAVFILYASFWRAITALLRRFTNRYIAVGILFLLLVFIHVAGAWSAMFTTRSYDGEFGNRVRNEAGAPLWVRALATVNLGTVLTSLGGNYVPDRDTTTEYDLPGRSTPAKATARDRFFRSAGVREFGITPLTWVWFLALAIPVTLIHLVLTHLVHRDRRRP